jgi:hypothetical protein
VRVQQGPAFYLWCLQFAHIYNCQELLPPSLKQLSVTVHEEYIFVKALDTLVHFPSVVADEFVEHMTNCVRVQLPKKSQAFLPLLYYLTLAFGELPSKYRDSFGQMMSLSSSLLVNKI